MENSELIKNFERIRDYMRQFYVYGFRSRSEMGMKSPRSYDNERRRIESWLGDHMSFRREETGKQVFISMDSRSLEHNPLYNAFKAKSFTDKDITLHFYILDCLLPGRELSLMELVDEIETEYLCQFPEAEVLDVSTLRKKLKEYADLGMITIKKLGKEYVYSRSTDTICLDGWKNALDFYSESAPMGVIGSFLLDRLPRQDSIFRFKHHYMVHTLDSQILFQLVAAMSSHRWVDLTLHGLFHPMERYRRVYPCRIHISSQTGRQYLLGMKESDEKFQFFRLDTIHKVKPGSVEQHHDTMMKRMEAFSEKMWGVSLNQQEEPDHLEMTVHAEKSEPFILQRLIREKRNGTVTVLDENTYQYRADVYDALEMLPWIRTFIGRIVKLECSNDAVIARYQQDLDAMGALYGGE
ncbi:MAG: WYL domain-containing protein [Oscillospiraceae bacterium]|nr:WYL domain-containing protein [Oscillospiraceae bacterium]